MSSPVGMLVVDKPAGPTSHDVVVRVRRLLDCRAGHSGTLDPQATGVLLVCLGAATRLARFLQQDDKEYECIVRFGWATDTYDADGEALGEPQPVPELDGAALDGLLDRFRGEIQQVPPAYSAKKVRGQPSYRRARRGEQVEHREVTVRIDDLEILAVEAERLRLRLTCSSGTYVRTLAHDIGSALGCPSHLEALRRCRVGRFGLDRSLSWGPIESGDADALQGRIVPPTEMFPEWPAAILSRQGLEATRHGTVLEPRLLADRLPGCDGAVLGSTGPGAWVRLLDDEGRMRAAAEVLPGGMLQPRVFLG